MPFRLEFFEYEVHLPASRAWYRAAQHDGHARAVARSAMFEAYLWLQLGAHAGFFERGVAETMAKEGFGRFFASLAARENDDLRALRSREKDPLRLWDPEGRADLAARFPEHETTLRYAVLGKGLWLPTQEFAAPARLHPAFQAALLAAARLSADTLALECTATLSFWSDEWWDNIMQGQASAEAVARLAEVGVYDGAPTKAVLYAGFLRLLRHLQAFQDITRGMQQCEAIPYEDSLRLLRGVRELHAWRLDLRHAATKQRYQSLVDALDTALNGDLVLSYRQTAQEGYERAVGWLKRTAEGVTRAWGPEQAMAPPAEAALERV